MPRRRKKNSSPLIIAVVLAVLSVLILAGYSGYLPFKVIKETTVGGVRFKLDVSPTPPIRVSVNDLGKKYTFEVKIIATAPSSLQPGAIMPIFEPSNYVAVKNPLSVPAKVKAPDSSALETRGGRLLPFYVMPYYSWQYTTTTTKTTTTTATKTTTTIKTTTTTKAALKQSSDTSPKYLNPGDYWLFDPGRLYYIQSATQTYTPTQATTPTQESEHKYRAVITIDDETKTVYLAPGETKTITFKVSRTVGESTLGVTYTLGSAPVWVKISVAQPGGFTSFHGTMSFKPFTAIPLSKGVHIQNVVTDAESGKVSYEIVNDWLAPIKVVTGVLPKECSQVTSCGNVEKKTVTIPAGGKVRVEFIDEQVKTFFSGWHVGQPTSYTKKISACIIPEGEQYLFSHGGMMQKKYQCVSALAVFNYKPPEVEVGLEVSGQGSVVVKHNGKVVTPPFKARLGDQVTVEMKAAEGYVIGAYGFKKTDGSYAAFVAAGSMYSKEHGDIKTKTWTYTIKKPGRIFVKFVVPKSVTIYTTTTGTKTQTKVILPDGTEYKLPEHQLASECLTFAVKVDYAGHVVNVGNPRIWEEVEEASGTMTVKLIAENTCPDDAIEVKLTIALGGPIHTPVHSAERRVEFTARIDPGGRVERSQTISLDGLSVYRRSGDRYRLHFEYIVQARYPDKPGDTWKAVPPYSVPVILLTPAEKSYSETGGIIHKPRPDGTEEVEFAPQATETGIQYPEIQLTKEPGDSKVEATGSYGSGLTESYQPVKAEIEHKPSGEKTETTAVIEPPIAAEHDTDPGVVSYIPKAPSKPLGYGFLDQIWKLLTDFWNWLLSLFGIK